MNSNGLCVLIVVFVVTSAHAGELSSEQKSQIFGKCKEQAAQLAHVVDENSKPRTNYETFDRGEITRIDGGYYVRSKFKMRWDIEAYGSSIFTVEMGATLSGACDLLSITRN